jgi:hypothetical protein
MRMRILLVACAALALSVGVATATAGGGNSDAAKACQKGGYMIWVRADGSSFTNTGDCVSYAVQGGTLVPDRFNDSAGVCTSIGAVFGPIEGDWTFGWLCTKADFFHDSDPTAETAIGQMSLTCAADGGIYQSFLFPDALICPIFA